MTENETETAPTGEACPGCGKVHGEKNPKLTAILDRVTLLDEERKNLLADVVLSTISEGLHAVSSMEGIPRAALEGLTVLTNLTNLSGYTLGAVAEAHEDWTRTGDKTVNALLVDYLKLINDAQIHEDDLPEGVADRLKSGDATKEDYAAVRALVTERSGMDPGELSADSGLVVKDESPEDHYVAPPDLRYL